MEYFNLLEFKKEPFSNSPEPEFLFASPQHNTCLQMLELAVRLKRGLNIVIGAVGTGKTTLCRKLIQNLSLPTEGDTSNIETFLLLDPAVESKLEFVRTVAAVLGIGVSDTEDNEWHIKEKIKKFLFDKGVDERKIIALVIDEGQKIPDDCLEILREFLNYETNDFKLLQIVIFAQPELRKSLLARANLKDRINYLYYLKPLSFLKMKAMIEYRVAVASQRPDNHALLSVGGLIAVYLATSGYPRKVVSLCHQIVLMMIIKGKGKAGWFLVRSCVRKNAEPVMNRMKWATVCMFLVLSLSLAGAFYFSKNHVQKNSEKHKIVLSGIDLKKEYFSSETQTKTHEVTKMLHTVPVSLGSIRLKKRMTIWRIFENIYGISNEEVKQIFTKANPQIKDINDTSEGTIIDVPAIPAEKNILKVKPVMISIEQKSDLESIYYSFIRQRDRTDLPGLLFVTLWTEKNGKQFFIMLDKRFKSTDEAHGAIRQLPLDLSTKAKVWNEWEDGTINFNRRFTENDTSRRAEAR